jgi:hypothetical protein
MLALESLRQLYARYGDTVAGRIGAEVFAAPDIDMDVFSSAIGRIGPLAGKITVVTSTNDRALALSGRIAGGMTRALRQLRNHPPGPYGKCELTIILKADERSIHLGQGNERNLSGKSSGWGENRASLRATSSRRQSKTAAGCSITRPQTRDRRSNLLRPIFRTTETALQGW